MFMLKRLMLVVLLVNAFCQSTISSAADSAPAITLYTTTYCGECLRAKTYLRKQGLDFVEYDVEQNSARLDEFHALGGRAVPFFVIAGKTRHGFDPVEIERMRTQAVTKPAVRE